MKNKKQPKAAQKKAKVKDIPPKKNATGGLISKSSTLTGGGTSTGLV